MHAENFIFDDGGNRHTIEAINEGFPKFGVVTIFTLNRNSFYIIQKSHKFV